MRSPDQPVRIGMLGCGVVGSEVARLIMADSVELSTRAGAKIELVKIAVREIKQRVRNSTGALYS
jgi:homoserine dehydrogenase